MSTLSDNDKLKIAVRLGILDEDQLVEAMTLERSGAASIEDDLVSHGFLDEEGRTALLEALADPDSLPGSKRVKKPREELQNKMRAYKIGNRPSSRRSAGEEQPVLEAEALRARKLSYKGYRFGKYQIQKEIARGGMGAVFRARDRFQGELRTVALKVMDPVAMSKLRFLADPSGGDGAVDRFIEEIRSLIHLQHPNIVPIFDAGMEEGLSFFTMAYVQGPSAWDIVTDHGRLPVSFALEIIYEIASALQSVHALELVHRDIKPHNILIDRDQEPYRPILIDFGLIRRLGDTRPEAIMGTPGYMAPEQVEPRGRFGRFSPATDVYGLGATLYFLLVGRAPFGGGDAKAIMKQVTDEPAPRVSDALPGIPGKVDALCARALSKQPQDRYPNLPALIKVVGRLLGRRRLFHRLEDKWARLRHLVKLK